ncbi:MAG TPA: acyl-CoA synthetase [Holophagaceae bacterium]|nr:acyl-CoA synthetase [Geothrix sp.]HJW34612.1 acyl-CoA synthetase [Holophagaceae bacterium]
MNAIACMADVLALESMQAPSQPNSSYEMIRAAAAANPGAPALSFFPRVEDHERAQVWNYEALLAGINASANLFHEVGVGVGDVVAFVLPNLPQTHLVIWGGQATGIVFPINPMLEAAAIADLLIAGQAKVLVTLAPGTELWRKLRPVLGSVPSLEQVFLLDPAGADLPDGLPGGRDALPVRIGVHDFTAGMRKQPTDRLVSGRRIQPGDLSSYFCTGGTTGAPKIAMRTHGNEVANAWSTAQLLGDGIGPGKNIFCGLPLFHVNAVLVTGLLPFSKGAHVILGTPQGYRDADVVSRFWELVEHHRINFFSAVPTLYAALLQQPMEGRDLSSLQYGLCGAAPMPVELMRNFEQRTGLRILEGYGLTEGTCVSSCNPPRGERRIGSIGLRLPWQPMKAVVLDEADAYLRDCKTGEVGVFLIGGPNVFSGYKAAEHNQGLWVDCGDGRRWLNTGDLGCQDAEGYFHLTGRKKELIIRGGHNIDPASIEGPLHLHPAVQLVAAVGRPDVHAGELPVAYVQLKSGACVTEDELMSFAMDQIAERAARPKAIRLVAAMPLTGVGKIFKPELRQREIEDALRTALHDSGASIARMHVINDPKSGIQVEVTVAGSATADTVREVLGRFPFRFEVSSAS